MTVERRFERADQSFDGGEAVGEWTGKCCILPNRDELLGRITRAESGGDLLGAIVGVWLSRVCSRIDAVTGNDGSLGSIHVGKGAPHRRRSRCVLEQRELAVDDNA